MRKIIVLLLLLVIINCGSTQKGLQKTATPEKYDQLNLNMLKEELRKNHTDPQAHLRMGIAYADIDSIDLALVHYDSALYYDPSLTQALLEKGTILVKQNKIKEGYSYYINILKSDDGENYASEIASRIGQPYPIHQITSGDYNNAYGYLS